MDTKTLVAVIVVAVLAAVLGYAVGLLSTDESHATAITTTTVTKNTTATVTVTSRTVLGINPWEVYFSPDEERPTA